MTQFHEGQEVEVLRDAPEYGEGVAAWRKAKIAKPGIHGSIYTVEFDDATSGIFDEAHLRPIPEVVK